MHRMIWSAALILGLCASVATAQVAPANLSKAPAEELLRVYDQLRHLRGSDQWAIAENVVWKRDAATFTFREGRFAFATPVQGRVVAAVFQGEGTFLLNPPTSVARRQISRFSGEPKLEESFREAVFFFTDDSWPELQKLMRVQAGGDPLAAAKVFESSQKKVRRELQ